MGNHIKEPKDFLVIPMLDKKCLISASTDNPGFTSLLEGNAWHTVYELSYWRFTEPKGVRYFLKARKTQHVSSISAGIK